MDPETLEALVGQLEQTAARVEAAVRQVSPDAWGEVIHTGDGAWTRRKLLAHLAANDRRQLIRIRIGAGIPNPGDEREHEAELQVDAWNQARVDERDGRSIDDLVGEMLANRAELIALVRRLTPEQRDRPMPFRGTPTPLGEMIRIVNLHFDMHAAELTG